MVTPHKDVTRVHVNFSICTKQAVRVLTPWNTHFSGEELPLILTLSSSTGSLSRPRLGQQLTLPAQPQSPSSSVDIGVGRYPG